MKQKLLIIIIIALTGIIGFLLADRGPVDISTPLIQKKKAPLFNPDHVGKSRLTTITETYEAVGTVKPQTEAIIEAQISAQVKDIHATPGTAVDKGDLLISLDNRQALSGLERAKQGLKAIVSGEKQTDQAVLSAKAGFKQAESNFNRVKQYYKSEAATSQEYETAESSYLQARAGLSRAMESLSEAKSRISQAKELVRQAQIVLEYTTIKAPDAGTVLKRFIEPGDIALPGKPLILLQTSTGLRLEAHVREGLVGKVKLGEQLQVKTGINKKQLVGIVDEIIPYADPDSRTFLVKAKLPDSPDIYPGMFGKLMIPSSTSRIVITPVKAIKNVGQLTLVMVKEKNRWKRQFVKTGRKIGDNVEILSGLNGDETIGWKE